MFGYFKDSGNQKDRRILLEVHQEPCQPDGIAKELYYHESCYRNYTHQKTLANMLDSQISLEDAQHSTAYDRAFQTLTGEVEEAILSEDEQGLFLKMSDLRLTFVDFLKQEGVDTPNYTISKLKRRLQKNFGNRIVFFANPQTVTEPELVTSATACAPTIEWTTKPQVPVDVLKLIGCSCKTGCSSKHCSCQTSFLPCTNVCQCDNCENPKTHKVLQPASTIASANAFEADHFDEKLY